nr:DUF389 domain-containing protein [Streptomyces sp. HNM0575]
MARIAGRLGRAEPRATARDRETRLEYWVVWQSDMMSFVVAVLAGVAGMLSLTSAKSGALVGVAISVTTVPAAADAAMALSYGDPRASSGSAQQLAVNLAGILVAGTLTLLAQKAFWSWKRRHLARTGTA